MKAKKAWIKFDKEYKQWQFSPILPYDASTWTEIVYFEVEEL